MKSIWDATTKPCQDFPTLNSDLNTEVVIIGAGMAGILTAYLLQQAGIACVILEANKVGQGQTHHTTAKITVQHGIIYQKLLNAFSQELAEQYLAANQSALRKYEEIVTENSIDCDFTHRPAFLYSLKQSGLLKQELLAAQQLGIDASLTSDTELPFPVDSALCFANQASFNPLKFLYSLASGLKIFENTPVISVDNNKVVTKQGTITANKIVFACHYPFINVPGYYFARMHQERSYVLALSNTSPLEGMYLGIDEDGFSFRPDKDFLLLGGGNHRTGENSTGGKYDLLRKAAAQYWPHAEVIEAWSAQDCMTIDGVPYIGQFAASQPNWYVATGFQKWGMTTSMAAAMIISEQILKGNAANEEVFSPQRFVLTASAKTLAQDAGQSIKGLSRRLFESPRAEVERLPLGHGGVVEVDGEKVGVYKDEHGQTFIVSIKCPHLGCQLEWNPDEKSWDCPCHGSRFDYLGRLIDNPAQNNLSAEDTPASGLTKI